MDNTSLQSVSCLREQRGSSASRHVLWLQATRENLQTPDWTRFHEEKSNPGITRVKKKRFQKQPLGFIQTDVCRAETHQRVVLFWFFLRAKPLSYNLSKLHLLTRCPVTSFGASPWHRSQQEFELVFQIGTHSCWCCRCCF